MSTWLPSFRNEIDSASEAKSLPDEQPTPSMSEMSESVLDEDMSMEDERSISTRLSTDEQEVIPSQILGYAEWLEIPESQPELLWIAEYGLTAPLPEDWRTCLSKDNSEAPEGYSHVRDKMYFYNIKSGESSWEHPCDKFFRELARSFVRPDEVIKIPRSQQEPLEYKTTGVQATPTVKTTHTQVEQVVFSKGCHVEVPTASVGTAPMPVTMTTMTNICCDGGTNTTPGIENLIPPPSMPGSKRASRVRLDPFSSPAMFAASNPTMISTGGGTGIAGGGVSTGVKDHLTTKAKNELKSRVISDFQEQLASHKKEILEVIARETPIPPIPEADTPLAPLPPPSFPTAPATHKEVSNSRSRLVIYSIVLSAHISICFAVVTMLPYVFDPLNYSFFENYSQDDYN